MKNTHISLILGRVNSDFRVNLYSNKDNIDNTYNCHFVKENYLIIIGCSTGMVQKSSCKMAETKTRRTGPGA